MKKLFNSKSETVTIKMDHKEFWKLFCAIKYEAERTEYTVYKEEFQELYKALKESDFKCI